MIVKIFGLTLGVAILSQKLVTAIFPQSILLNCFKPTQAIFLIVLGFVLLFIFLLKEIAADMYLQAFLGVFLGGSLFNLISRTATLCVVDYFSFFGLFKFNVADIFIVTSAVVLALKIIMTQNGSRKGGDL